MNLGFSEEIFEHSGTLDSFLAYSKISFTMDGGQNA